MKKRCLKCGYIRELTDTAPDYECPKCGAVYAKVEAALTQKNGQRPPEGRAPTSESSALNLAKYETFAVRASFILLIISGVAFPSLAFFALLILLANVFARLVGERWRFYIRRGTWIGALLIVVIGYSLSIYEEHKRNQEFVRAQNMISTGNLNAASAAIDSLKKQGRAAEVAELLRELGKKRRDFIADSCRRLGVNEMKRQFEINKPVSEIHAFLQLCESYVPELGQQFTEHVAHRLRSKLTVGSAIGARELSDIANEYPGTSRLIGKAISFSTGSDRYLVVLEHMDSTDDSMGFYVKQIIPLGPKLTKAHFESTIFRKNHVPDETSQWRLKSGGINIYYRYVNPPMIVELGGAPDDLTSASISLPIPRNIDGVAFMNLIGSFIDSTFKEFNAGAVIDTLIKNPPAEHLDGSSTFPRVAFDSGKIAYGTRDGRLVLLFERLGAPDHIVEQSKAPRRMSCGEFGDSATISLAKELKVCDE